MNIVIIGMRGTGKTTIGKMLSESLRREFFETDVLVVKKENQPIAQIVSERGWDTFRDVESDVVEEVTLMDNNVISTGGGVVVRERNMKLLKQNSIVILLTASIDSMNARLQRDSERPSLTSNLSLRKEIAEVLQKRKHLYEKAADITVSTDNQNPEEILHTILKKIHL